jgi:hypothetical protein
MKRNKFLQGPILPIAAVALLAMSAVGSTRAALTEYSENITAQFETASLSVALVEQTGSLDAQTFKTDTTTTTDGEAQAASVSAEGLHVVDLEGKEFQIGKKYGERISVQNDGAYDEYVRVIVTKSWQNEDGSKDTTLDPDLIELGFENLDANWIEVDVSPEQTIYYYKSPLAAEDSLSTGETAGSSEVMLINSVMVQNDVTTQVTTENLKGTITNTYDYNGKSFSLEVEVDAVQTHNAADAILGAWGVKAEFDGDALISITEPTTESGTETNTEEAEETASRYQVAGGVKNV